MIVERIDARLIDIVAQIALVKEQAKASVTALEKERAALLRMKELITPELLDAVRLLQAAGLLKDL